MSTRVLKIIHNVAITAIAPRKSPTANLKTVTTLMAVVEFISERIKLTNKPFKSAETIITKYKNL